jgi:type I restriction enzyme M protein
MITKDNFKDLLLKLQFIETNNVFTKHFENQDYKLIVDFHKHLLIYPEDKGLIINERQTCNFTDNENFVVFECVNRLLEKGYKPEHIELEPKWKVGRGASGGRADILIKNQENNPLLLIECKTADKEFKKAWKEMQQDGGQLFSYAQQISETQFLCLYASDITEDKENKNLQLIDYQRIISHKDNQKILEQDDKLKSFAKAKSVKERFEVWKNTYQLEFTEKGIFEENIQAYQIGKDKYTLTIDTKPVQAIDKKGKYHDFRTILRKYNVSRRENAFEVLVNLFLCKIVDEKENPQDLKFYWKGIAYDNYYDLVDRLQELYQIGMKRFLDEEILYISNKQIDEAFWTVKDKRNATKKRIKEIFRELKFFKGLDFEFIKVHNKIGFNKNAKILLEIIQMWQGLRLNTEEQNQFLGDMFEYFLDNGIKQTEGQFFTPIPICKFIVMSLPLETMIKQKSEPLRAIDYACGAGHFLNEYALQIKSFVATHKQAKIEEYYKEIYGIEKEDRLAKVAKVSAFMYGQDEIQIIDADALATHPKIKEENFDVLVANPPFAVEDFLLTLDEEDQKKYQLLETVSDIGNKNIQCFFLEKAKNLLAPNGVTGIIVPTSVLSNSDAMHIQTREILLQYFDIISLVELGSGTFGKTGTNTVVLFLRRKAQRPEQAEHFWNRVQDYFENGTEEIASNGSIYQDLPILKKYCQHINIPFEDYQHILNPETYKSDKTYKVSKDLIGLTEKYEIFKEYKADFDSLTDIKKLKENKQFKAKTTIEQETELNKRFLAYLHKVEMQKFYYFMLAYHNGNDQPEQKVLVVKSPADNKERKNFLGYEWSGAKGDEGIKYNGGETVYDIETMLFNPKNTDDQTKINYLIQQNFQSSEKTYNEKAYNEKTYKVSENLIGLVNYANLTDLLDFSRKDFNKAISITIKKKVEVESKWEMVKLGEILAFLGKGKRPASFATENGTIPFVISSITHKKCDIADYNREALLIGDGGSANVHYFKGEFSVSDHVMLMESKEKTNLKYIYYLLSTNLVLLEEGFVGIAIKNISRNFIENIKIPKPDLEIQEKIVLECEAIDKAVEKAKTNIGKIKQEIENLILGVFGNYPDKKLSDICLLNPSKTEIKNVDENTIVSFVEMASVSNDGFIAEKVDTPLKDLKKGSYTYFAENDIIIAKITPCMENGKCALATNLSNGLAMGSSEFHVIRVKDEVLNKYIFALLNREIIRKEAEQNMTGSSGHRRVPANFYADYKIPVPPLSTQETLVSEIEKLELQIAENQGFINGAKAKKEEVLKRYL